MKDQPGSISIEVSGNDLSQLTQEAGNHRLQRVPPTERKGRVHTSSIVVAVLDGNQQIKQSELPERDLRTEWYSGTGCGGQARNKNMTSCRLTHIPSGISKTSQTRSRVSSYDQAYQQLTQCVNQIAIKTFITEIAEERKRQTGSGQRADNKVRTYRFQDDIASDTRTGKKVSLSKVMNGNFNLLW